MADGVGPEITVRPLTAELWDDAITVFGTRGDPASCWCQFFILSSQDWRSSTRERNRERLRAQCDQAVPPGLVGYRDGEAAGWVAVAPRVAYPRILRSRTLAPVLGAESLDDSRIWSVTCFVVRVGFRRQGMAAALLEAAVGFAAAHGAAAVEGYPVEVGERGSIPASELYHGAASTFASCGFEEVGRSSARRPVMRRLVGRW